MVKISKFAAAAVIAAALALSCVYPVYDGDDFRVEEQQSVWQYLSVYSIFRNRLPSSCGDLTPQEMFSLIADTLKGGRYTGYYYPTSGGGGGPKPLPDTVIAVSSSTVYFRFNEFNESSMSLFRAKINFMSGYENIVIDMRNNGGGYISVAEAIASEFLPFNTDYIYYRYRAYSESQRSGHDVAEVVRSHVRSPRLLNKNVSLLVNHYSASASEILASGLKDRAGARIVGDTTYGKGIGQVVIPRHGRTTMLITFLEISGLTLRTGDYHRTGIAPDTIPDKFVAEAHTELANIDPLLSSLFEADSNLYYAIKWLEPSITENGDADSREETERFVDMALSEPRPGLRRVPLPEEIGAIVVSDPDPLPSDVMPDE